MTSRIVANVEVGDRPKPRKWMFAVAIAAVLAAALLVARHMHGFGDSSSPELRLYGNVDVREIDLAFRVPGRIVAIHADEGDKASVGQVIAELDKRPLRDAYAMADARLGIAEASLAKAQAGNRVQEVRQAEAKLREAISQADLAKRQVDRRAGLAETGAISRREYEETAAQYREALAGADYAREAVSLLRAGSRTEDRQAAAAQAAAARAERDSARTGLEDATLTTPLAGTVITRVKELGAIVRPGETVLTLAIETPVRIRAYVGGADLSRISPGLAVRIKADGNDRTYTGKISQISPNAEFTPKTVQTEDLRTDLVYRVRILVDRSDGALRQGQPVTISIPQARPRGTR